MKHLLLLLVVASCGGTSPPAVANTSTDPALAPAAPAPVAPTEPALAPAPAPAPAPQAVKPPVAVGTTIPCDRWGDAARFTSALGEAKPLTVKEVTKQDADATSSCALVRGGKQLTDAEQTKLLKKNGRLGVLPGDVVCNVTAYCWTIEEPARFTKTCTARGDRNDDAVGPHACVAVFAQGSDDVKAYRILDDDSRCVLAVRGGPSNVDNGQIQACAKTAIAVFGAGAIAAP